MNITAVKKSLLIGLLVVLGFTSTVLLAQDKNEQKSKLEKLKGKIEKITVKVDGADVVFEGKEAESLAKKLQTTKESKTVWVTKNGEKGTFDVSSKPHVLTFVSEDEAEEGKEIEKKINVELNDGKKKVTVTTKKDGKEETKVYEGDEAEKFLKDNESGDVMVFKTKKGDAHWVDGSQMKAKKIKVNVDEGGKKVIITKTKDGKEETKIIEGDEAEKFLKEGDGEDDIHIFVSDDDSEKGEHVIIMKSDDDSDECCVKMKKMDCDTKEPKKVIIKKMKKDSEEKSEKSEKK